MTGLLLLAFFGLVTGWMPVQMGDLQLDGVEGLALGSIGLLIGFGAVALGLKDNGFSYLLLLFYNQVIGLPAPTVGLAIMIALIADAMLDPVIGQVSDNWRSRWGRRHPFMYLSAAPIAVSYFLLWHPPLGWSDGAMFAYLIVTAMVIRWMP